MTFHTGSETWFDGATYNHELDQKRLTKQINRVWQHMNDGVWHTLSSVSDALNLPEASISARFRDFRKERFGSHTIERARMCNGQWRYKLTPKAAPGFDGDQTRLFD